MLSINPGAEAFISGLGNYIIEILRNQIREESPRPTSSTITTFKHLIEGEMLKYLSGRQAFKKNIGLRGTFTRTFLYLHVP